MRKVADSQRNRSMLKRLSFMWPRNVSQDGPAPSRPRPVVMGENPSNHVFVNRKVEGQGNLFSNSRTAPAVVPLLHFHNRMDEFCTRSLRAGLGTAIGGEQHAVLFLAHGLVKAEQGRGLQHNGRSKQASGTQPERQPASKDPVRRGQIRRSLPGAIQDQELMLEQKRLGNEGTGTARSEQTSQAGDEWIKRTTRSRITES